MGCWNQTCGLTQIHIRAGEKVVVFPLVESDRDSLCYSTPFWTPFPVPFVSEYNDYGAGENSSGIGLELVLNFIREKLVEIEVGENKRHDIAVHREGFDEDKFWSAIHKRRLTINTYQSQKEIGFVMIKKSVLDYLIEHEEFAHYDGYEAGVGSKYTKYKFADVLSTLERIVDKLFSEDDEYSDLPEEVRIKLRHLKRYRILEQVAGEIKDSDKNCWAAQWLGYGARSHLNYGGFSSNIVESKLVDFIEAGNRDGARELLTQYLTMQFVDSFLMSTRKFWSPQAGAGSQDNDPDGYRLLAAAMTHVLDIEEAEQDEW